MNLKIHHLNYSRNGVQGNPFYTAHIELDGQRLIATFETVEGFDNIVNCETCRVVNIDKPFNDYRGDQIGTEISMLLGQTNTYDLIGVMKYPELYPGTKPKVTEQLRKLGSDMTLYGDVQLKTWQEDH